MTKFSPQAHEEAKYLAEVCMRMQPNERRFDADETNMLALQLEQMRARVYEVEYPVLKARRFLPIDTEIDSGAESYSAEETDEVGEAKVIRNYADDPPTVETSSSKTTRSIVSLGDSFFYTLQDIRRAAFSGKPLSARKASAARRAWERGLDSVAALGAPDDGIPDGICNKTVGTSDGQIRGNAVTAAAWKDATLDPDQMVADLNAGVQDMIEASDEAHTPNLLLLSLANFLRLSQTRMSTENSETALEAFLRSNPFIEEVASWNKLKEVDGAGDNTRGLLLERSPDVVELVISQEYEVLSPQPHNYGFRVLAHGRTGGVDLHRPLGLHYLTGFPADPTA